MFVLSLTLQHHYNCHPAVNVYYLKHIQTNKLETMYAEQYFSKQQQMMLPSHSEDEDLKKKTIQQIIHGGACSSTFYSDTKQILLSLAAPVLVPGEGGALLY